MERQEIQDLADLSATAYDGKNKHWQEHRIDYVTGHNFHAALVGLPDRIIVAFPGTHSLRPELVESKFTANLRQWLTNIAIGQRDVGPYGVHAGYLSEVNAMRKELLTAIRDNGGDEKRVIFTGHSAGGALAQLAAARLMDEDDYPVEQVLSFSAPRVGDDRFRDRMDDYVVRLERRHDLVPHLPFSPLVSGYVADLVDVLHHLVPQLITKSMLGEQRDTEYRHAGRLFWYSPDSDWYYNSTNGYIAGWIETLTDDFGEFDAVPIPKAYTGVLRFVSTIQAIGESLSSGDFEFLLDHHIVRGITAALAW
jgi:pimeloyl-ACP methyl ester carboxylesterase